MGKSKQVAIQQAESEQGHSAAGPAPFDGCEPQPKLLIEKVIELRRRLKVPKNRYNEFGRFNYRNLEDILEAVKPGLADLGLLLVITDELVEIGSWHYVRSTTSLSDGNSEPVTSVGYAREPEQRKGMDESQITGCASSYARKYALNGLLLLDDTKDADTNEHHRMTTQRTNHQAAKSPAKRKEWHETEKDRIIDSLQGCADKHELARAWAKEAEIIKRLPLALRDECVSVKDAMKATYAALESDAIEGE